MSRLLVLLALSASLAVLGQGTDAHHDHPAPPPAADSGPPKPEQFLRMGDDGKLVKLVLVSAWNGANYGMNFDGFAKGGAKLTVPLGAEVEVTFTNRSPVPHSVIVVERPMVRRLQMGDPAFEGASTPNPVKGTTGSKGEVFKFKASEAGDFAFACGFPSHAANGHWIALEVSASATVPSLQFGTEAAYTPKGGKP